MSDDIDREYLPEKPQIGRPVHITTQQEAFKYLYRRLGAGVTNQILNAVHKTKASEAHAAYIKGREDMCRDIMFAKDSDEDHILERLRTEPLIFSGNTCANIIKRFGIEGITTHKMSKLLRQAGYVRKYKSLNGKPARIWIG